MTDEEKKRIAPVKMSDAHTRVEFALTDEQKEAVIECIRKTGKVSIHLRAGSLTKLPGRGQGVDFDGDLID